MQMKILVADDSASDRSIIQNLLREYCVFTACDGVETVAKLKSMQIFAC